MKVSAPAKLNLNLRIHGKREDGFHEIETLMASLSLADDIEVETCEGDEIRIICDDPSVPADGSNLAAVAAVAFRKRTGLQFGVRIEIHKRIPSGAGLGGGSSDAAAVIVALDSISNTGLGFTELEKIAGEVGSDVPFFIRGVSAICRGRGESVEPCALPGPAGVLLVKPPFPVETAWAYKAWKNSKEIPGVDYSVQSSDAGELFNDLERPVFEKFQILPVIKSWLRDQPEVQAALMSGSGSTMFAILKSGAGGEGLAERVRENFGQSLWTSLCKITA